MAEVNGVAGVRILDALRTFSPETRFYQASTSEMFGLVQEVPQSERTRFYPRSPYGVAKVYGHHITVNYRESFEMHASSGILFDHESPLRWTEFVTRKITLALTAVAHGSGEILRLGNLNTRRDWGFAGEYLEGMWRMLHKDAGDDCVLATGVTTPIRDFVRWAGEAVGMDLAFEGEELSETAMDRRTGRTVLAVDARYYRSAEVDLLIGDATKARTVLDWAPKIEVRELAEMMARSDQEALA